MSDKEENISVIKEMFHNKDIRRGFLCFAIALILAFVAVTPQVSTYTEKGKVTPEEGKQYFPLLMSYRTRNSTLELNYESNETSDQVTVFIYNNDNKTLKDITLNSTSTALKIDLTDFDTNPAFLEVNISSGVLRYSQTLAYTRHPYSLLSLPAAFLTLLGMVYSFKGKGALLMIIKEKKKAKEGEETETGRESEKRNDEEGEQEKDKKDEKDLSERSEKDEREKAAEMGLDEKEGQHVDFMGVPGGLGGDEDEE